MSGWDIEVVGGSPTSKGSVTQGSAILREGDSFLVALQRSFAVPENPAPLVFRYTDLSFDTSDPDSINDAFEASVIDGNGNTLVHTIATGRDAFYNATEGLSVALGPGTVEQGDAIKTVTLDMSGVLANTVATVRFRLVNNDQDTNTSVRILDVLVPDDAPPQVSVALQNDTAPDGPGSEPFRIDGLTNDPIVVGVASDDQTISRLEAKVDSGQYQDITAALVNGQFRYDPGALTPGPHRITIRAADTSAQQTEQSLDFVVNSPPTADAGGARTVSEGSSVHFDGSASSDAEEPLFGYRWEFHDAVATDRQTATRQYNQDGVFNVVLTVTDTAGSVATDSIQVTVQNVPATVAPIANRAAGEGETVTFVADFSDPGILDTHSATVDWGDGIVEPATIIEQNGTGTATASHVYADNGAYAITVKVIDEGGALGTQTFTINVGNANPSLQVIADRFADEGQVVSLPPAFFIDLGTLDVHFATVDWGDGSSPQPATVNQSPFGPPGSTTGASGTIAASHVYADDGVYTVQLVAQDDDGGKATRSFLVTVGNVSPSLTVAADQTTIEGSMLAINDLGIFTDPGFDNVVLGKRETFTFSIDWGDGSVPDTGLARIDVAGGPASLTRGSFDGSHVYGDNGDYTVSATVTDDNGGSVQKTFTVLVKNADPSLGIISDQSTDAGQVVSLPATLFTDLGTLDSHRVTINWGDGTSTDGVVTESPFGPPGSTNGLTGTIAGNHTYANGGDYVVTVTLTDDDAGADVTSFVVRVGEPVTDDALFRVPGTAGQDVTLEFKWHVREAGFNNEMGIFVVDDAQGSVGGKRPTDTGYWAAALGRAQVIFMSGQTAGISRQITLPAGTLLSHYLVKNSTTSRALQQSGSSAPTNPHVWFALENLNADGFQHWSQTELADGRMQYQVEDLAGGGDQDFDDMVFTVAVQRPSYAGQSKFFVVDTASDEVLRYDPGAAYVGFSRLRTKDDGNTDPRGIASNRQGTRLWVIDSDKRIYVYNGSGNFLGSWQPKELNSPQGVATDGTDIWIVNSGDDTVRYYRCGAVFRTCGSTIPTTTYRLHAENTQPSDIVMRDGLFWVTDEGRDQVFVYDVHNNAYRYLGRWSLDARNTDASGITLDPSGASNDLWVVDRVDRVVYAYAGGTDWRDGVRSASSTFALAIANTRPEGIADPPILNVSHLAGETTLPAGETIVLTGQAMDGHDPAFPVRINGQAVDVLDAAGNFFHQVQVAAGTNEFRIEASDAVGGKTTSTVKVQGTQLSSEVIDFNRLSVVSGSTLGLYGRTSWQDASSVLHVEFGVTNISQYAVDGPVLVGVANISDPTVRLFDATRTTPSGIPYFDITSLVNGGNLQAGDSSNLRAIGFFVPNRGRFTYDLVFFAGVNEAPRITTLPEVEAILGQPYRYDVDATDPNGDSLVYSLAAGPTGMTVAATTGEISWSPTSADQGMQTVIVQVNDGRGGTTQQNYAVAVVEPPPNRPPVFTSVPVVAAHVNTEYEYQPRAKDADGDVVTFSLISGPVGMVVDPPTGLVSWSAAADQLGIQNVALQVSDGRGGTATQTFAIRLGQEPGNTPPVIISQPILSFDVPRLANAASGDVNPVHIDLDLELGESGTQTVSLTLPAISAGQSFADILFVVDETITMAGDHDWLEAMIPELDAALLARGIGPNRYILVGFGDFIVQDVTRLGHAHNLMEGLSLSMFGPTNSASLGSQTLGPLVPLAAFEVTATTTGPQVLAISDTANRPGAYRFQVHRPAVTTAPLTLGSVTSGSIDVPSEKDAYSFAISQPTRVYFDALTSHGGIKWSLSGPTGTLINNLSFPGSDVGFGPGSLNLVPGNYTLTISADSSVVTPYQFRLSDLAMATPLVPGTPVTASLNPANETDLYRFNAAAGDRFFFDYLGGSQSGAPFWRLVDPYGNVLFRKEFRPASLPDVDTLTLSQPGAYTVMVEGGLFDTTVNTYTINVQSAAISTTALVLDDVTTGAIAVAGEQDRYTFTLDTQKLLYFDSQTSNGSIHWTLTGPAGTPFLNQSFAALEANSPVLNLVAGNYTLTVDGTMDATGTYAFRLSALSSATPLTPGTPVIGDLNPANETDLYSFTAVAGDRFSFDVKALTGFGGSISRWRLIGPHGHILFNTSFDDINFSDVAPLAFSQPGNYTLLVEGGSSAPFTRGYTFVVVPQGNVPPPPPPPSTPLVLGTSVSNSIAAAGEQDHYSFELANASLLYFDALTNNGNLHWTLTGPAGTVVGARSFTASEGQSAVPQLNLIAGAYMLTVAASGSSTGNYTFRLSEFSQGAPLTPGTPVSGSLSPANETDIYQFSAAAGDRFYFDVQANTNAGFTRWQLIDPFGKSLFNNFFIDTGASDVDVRTLAQPGTYTLLLEGAIANTVGGSYTINVQPAHLTTTSLSLGDLVTSSISVAGEADQFTFTLANHSLLYFDSHTNNAGLFWSLVGPAGAAVSGRPMNSDSGLTVPAISVPAGDYALIIDGAGALTGNYAFRLSDLVAATPLTPGTPVSGQLSPGNETDLYQFTAAAGDRFFFDVQARPSSGLSRWQLIDPFGGVVFNNFFVNTSSSDVDVLTLTRPGTYTLLLEGGITETVVGPYTINVQPITITTTPLTLGELVSSSIAVQGEQDEYTFSLPAEARLAFDSLTNNGTLNWTLSGPTGPVVSSRAFNLSDGFNVANPVVNLPAGQYTLTIDGLGELGGPYSFRLSDLAAAVPLMPGTPISGTLSPANETDVYRFEVTAGERFYFDVQARTGAPGARWRLINPFGAVRFSSDIASPASDVGDIVLGTTGTFMLLIEGAIADTVAGTYTINVQPSPIVITPLAIGSTVSGSIAVPGEQDRYNFSLAAPAQLYFDAQTNNNNLLWTIAGPAGTHVSARSFTELESNHPMLSLPAGDYSLTVHGRLDATGPYNFRFSDLSSATPLTPGTPVVGSLAPSNESDIYSFTAAAGDLFFFDVLARTGQAARWRLVDPLGNIVFHTVMSSAADFVDTRSLALPGRYTLLVEGEIGTTTPGTYTFNVQPVTIVTQSLTLGSTVSDAIAVTGQLDRYAFTLPAASLVYFDALSNNSSVMWTLTGPAGTHVLNRSFTAPDATPIVNLPAGHYTLTVDGFAKGTGPYSFRVSELSSATAITPGTPASGTLSPPTETDLFRFNALANERYSFDVQDTNGRVQRWRLVDPLGSSIFSGGFGDIGATTLALSGQYTLLLEGAIGETVSGTYAFDVVPQGTATPPPPPPSTPLVLGTIVSDSIAASGEQDRYTFTLPSAALLFFDSLSTNGNLNWSLAGPAGPVVSNREFTISDAVNGNPVIGLHRGDYTLTVTASGANTGNYSFRLLDHSSATELTPGTSVSGSFSPANETDFYRFSASAGDRFFFDTIAWANPGSARWRLVDPYGAILFDFFAGSDVDVITAGQTGIYSLLLEAGIFNTVVGTYTINVRPVPINTTPLTIGSVNSGTLAIPGEQDRYTFSLANHSLLYFDSLTNNGNFNWILAGPAGLNVNRAFTTSDAVNVGSNPVLSLPAGEYSLTIDGNADATGNYAYRLNNLLSAAPVIPRTPIIGSLDPGNETDLYRFTASAGEQFYIDALSVSGPGGRWRLVDPYGNILFSNVFGAASTIEADVLTLQAGNHTLLVEGHVINTATSSYTIALQPVTFSSQPVSFGQIVNAALSVPGEQDHYTFTGVTGQRIFFDRLGPAANINANLFAPSTNLVFSTASTANFGPFFLPETGTYRLNFDATGDLIGPYGFVLHDVASVPQPDSNGDITGVLDQHLGSDLFLVHASAGQTLVFSPATDLFVGTAQQVSVATRSLLTFGNIEDGYEAIDAGLRLDAFREGAAINVVLVTDENRDALDPNLTFASTFTALNKLGAKVNGVHEATFRDGLGRVALGVDSQGIAYLADGAGGFIAAPGGVFVTGRESTKADYIDLEWALGGAAWDTAQLRGGGLPAASFTKAFVEIKVREIEDQLAVDLVASDPSVDVKNLTGIVRGVSTGESATFAAQFSGDGTPQSFDLLFVRPGANIVLGSIPVTINASNYVYPVRALDADGDRITFSLVDAPANAIIDAASGRITWAPPAVGVYRFVVQADDGRGGVDIQEYEVNVTSGAPNEAPTISSTAPTQATEELPFGYSVIASDPDGDLLTYFLAEAPAGMAIDGSSGRITWTPAVTQIGSHNVSVRVLDGRGGEDNQSFGLSVFADIANRDPQFVTDPSTSIGTGELYHYDASATDQDGDALVFDLVVAPSGMTVDAVTGVIVWRPTTNDVGNQHVILRVRDGRGGVELQSYDIAVSAVGSAPGFSTPTPAVPAVVGRPYEYQIRAHDSDGHTITYRKEAGPDNMSIDPATGLLIWTPAANEARAHVVIVTAVDTSGARTSISFTLEAVHAAPNDQPAIASTPRATIGLGATYLYQLNAFDPNNDKLTIILETAPPGMALGADRVIRWTPTPDQLGKNQVLIRVADGRGGVASQAFIIDVTADRANGQPRIVSTPLLAATGGRSYTYNVRGLDPDSDPLFWSLRVSPEGMSIDPILGTICWAPTADQAGLHPVVIQLDDGQGGFTTQTFTIDVRAVNLPPIITSTPPTVGSVGQVYDYAVQATDPDGDVPGSTTFFDCTADPVSQVGWWRAEGNATDDRRDNDGTMQGGASFAAGKFGLAFNLDGSNDHVTVPDHLGLRPANFTLEAWIKPASTTGFDSVIAKGATGLTAGYHGDTNAFWLGLADGKPRMYTSHDSVLDHFITGAAALTSNEWHHLAGTFDGTTKRLYANGMLVASGTIASPLRYDILDVPLTFGDDWVNGRASGLYPFHGQIDEPSIYNRALTTAEIQTIFNAAFAGKCSGTPPAGFRLTTSPAGMSIDVTSGLILWTPTPAQVGLHDVTVDVSDGLGGTARQSFTVVVSAATLNRPPTITSRPTFLASADLPYSYDADAIDPDGDSLTFALPSAPAGMSIDPTSGLISWTPADSQVGDQRVTVSVTDRVGNSAAQSYALRVQPANRPPAINSSPPLSTTAGLIYRYDVGAVDPDLNPLSYSLTSAPTGMSIDSLGRITWSTTSADVGAHAVTVVVNDPFGASASQSFDVTVDADTTAPSVLVDFDSPAALGSVALIFLSATDNVGVAELVLTVNGTPLALDANGRATFRADLAGSVDVVARAIDAAGNIGQTSATLQVIDTSDVSAPDVSITSPGEDAVITALGDVIGTVSDDNLLHYTLSLAPLGSAQFTEFARGTVNVIDGALGRLDPTLLQNDTYVLRLEATDAGGSVSTLEQQIHIEGNLKLGNFTLSFTDLTLPVFGVPITVSRTYDTLSARESRDFGFGWRLEFRNMNLRTSVTPNHLEEYGIFNPFKQGSRVYVTLPGGIRQGFTFRPQLAAGIRGGFVGIFEPRFVPDPGVKSSLTVTPADLRFRADGTVYDFATGIPYNPANPAFGGSYLLTTKEGIAFDIDGRTGQLSELSDTGNNRLQFSDSGIAGPEGKSIRFERDPQGRIIAVVDPAGQRIRYEYDSRGDLVAVSDRTNNRTQFAYRTSPAHYLEKVTDPLGREGVRTEYDALGRLSKLIDAAGNAVLMDFNPENQVSTVIDPLGHATTEEYDARGNTLTHIDALGGVTRRTFDADNNKLTETDPLGRTTTFTYNDRGDALTRTSPLGHTTISTYQAFTYGTTQLAVSRGQAAAPFTRITSQTDPFGNTTAFDYLDDTGELLSTTDAAGNVTKLDYERFGKPPTVITDALGNVTQFETVNGLLMRQIDALGHTVNFTYDANGNQLTSTTTQTAADGTVRTLTTRTDYDAEERVIAVTDSEGGITRTEYDAAGNTTATIDTLGRRTEYRYDVRNKLIETVYPDDTPQDLSDNPRTGSQFDAAGRETARFDELGRRTEYQYDALGRLIKTIYPDGTSTQTEYDAAGQVTAQVDQQGRRTELQYDAGGRQTVRRDPLGNATTIAYDAAGLPTTVTDALGHKTSYVRDASYRVIETRYADGTKTTITFDALGQVIALTDQLNRTTRQEYNALGRIITVIDPLGHATTFTYDEMGRQLARTTTQTAADGSLRLLTTRTEYDGLGRVIAVTDAEGAVTRTEYNAAGSRTASIDPLGRRTEFRYDEQNRLIETIYADSTPADLSDNPRITIEYDAAGQASARIDELGRRTQYQYDPLGRLVKTIYPDGAATQTEYSADGQVSARIDERGNRTEFEYDVNGRLIRTRDALGNSRIYAYDAADQRLADTDALGHTTQFVYDAIGQLIRTNYADGTSSSNTFDATGQVIARTDQLGRTTRYEYDVLGRTIAVVDALNQRTEYAYDETGNLISQEDANGHVMSYEYDGLNRRTATVLPLGQRSQTTYNAIGLPTAVKDFNGDTITYAYDERNRLAAKNFPDGASVNYAFTLAGQLDSVTDSRGITDYEYDLRDRLLSRTDPDGARISYTYDAAGKRTSLAGTVGAASLTTTYTFDMLNRLESVTDPDLGITRYAYDAAGNLVRTELPNSTIETRKYDDLNRLVFLENSGPSGVISSQRYTLAPTGHRASMVEQDGRRVDYTYDALDRLTREAITDAAFDRTFDYTYDAVGNRLTRNDSVEGLTDYIYDANDRLLTETLAGDLAQYTYDNNGNMLSRVSATDEAFYNWDFENRLLSVDTGGDGTIDVRNEYDSSGIRVSQTVAGEETRYLIDTVQPFAQVLLEYRPSGLIVASYVHGHGLISQAQGGARVFYHVDGLGSTRALTNATATVLNRYFYDAFGRIIRHSGATPNPNRYLFAGQQRDSSLGLDYLRARYYDPRLGRFVSADPLRGHIAEPIYSYAMNNPVNFTDPLGLFITLTETQKALAIQAILGGIAGYAITGSWKGALAGAAFGVAGGLAFSTLIRGVGLAGSAAYGIPAAKSLFLSELAFNLAAASVGVYEWITAKDEKEKFVSQMGLAGALAGVMGQRIIYNAIYAPKKYKVSGASGEAEQKMWQYNADRIQSDIALEGQGKNPWTKKVRIDADGRTGEISNLEGSNKNLLPEKIISAIQQSHADFKWFVVDNGAVTAKLRAFLRQYGGSVNSEGKLIEIQIWERDGNGLRLADRFAEPEKFTNTNDLPFFNTYDPSGGPPVDPLGATGSPDGSPGGGTAPGD